jgi:UDPglucose 6-dehydrogenase
MTNLSMLVYICETMNLHDVAEYWQHVLTMNEYQQQRFCNNIVHTMVNVKGKKSLSWLCLQAQHLRLPPVPGH